MSGHSLGLSPEVAEYISNVGYQEPVPLRRLRQWTAALGSQSVMQISPEQGALMRLLVGMIDAIHILEVGTFTGYSALTLALSLPRHGQIVACEIEQRWAKIAQEAWAEAGVANMIELRIGPAMETLEHLLRDSGSSGFDLAFIDADKQNYDAYYEATLRLVRPGGLILVDNTLWGGAVADEHNQASSTERIRALNAKIHADRRVEAVLVPIGDGLTIARVVSKALR